MPSADEIEELLRARLAELEPCVAEYRRIQGMLGPTAPARTRSVRAPGEGSLVRRVVVVVTAAGEPLRAREVAEHLRAAGHEYSWISVSNALHYAATSGALRRVARGLYEPPPEEG